MSVINIPSDETDVKDKSHYKYIRIDSSDRNPAYAGQNNSNFTVDLKETYLTQRVVSIRPYQAWVPNVFYNIRSSQGIINNAIQLDENGVGVANITIPEGQYTITEFITALTAAINAALTASVVAITIDPASKKLIFTFVGNTIAFDADITAVNNMMPVIGLASDKAYAAVQTMDYPYNLRGYDMVYIHSKTIGKGNLIDGDSGLISTIASVSFDNAEFGSMGYYQATYKDIDEISFTDPIDMSVVEIKLRDNKGNILDIGLDDMTIILRVELSKN